MTEPVDPGQSEALLASQWRLLEAGGDAARSPVERARALLAVSRSLDRFFAAPAPAGTPPAGRREAQRLARALADCLRQRLLPSLRLAGVEVLDHGALDRERLQAASRYFDEVVFPTLTPRALDQGRPFPQVPGPSLNLAVLVGDGRGERLAVIEVPPSLPRLLRLEGGPTAFLWLEALVAARADRLFPGFEVAAVHQFHVSRRATPPTGPRSARGSPRLGGVARLIVSPGAPSRVTRRLLDELGANPLDLQRLEAPLGTAGVEALLGAAGSAA